MDTTPGLAAAPTRRSDALRAKAVRGSAWIVTSMVGDLALRLGSNLILTRLLFPEAFGLLALVRVVIRGVKNFSDLGVRANIVSSRRGDDPVFLDTAWTLQVVRGFALALLCVALAWPMASFYEEPLLAALIAASAIGPALAGFISTKVYTSDRHLVLGPLTAVNFASHVLATVFTIGIAWVYPSPWALVLGGIAGETAGIVFGHALLPGAPNRFRWDRDAVREILGFGKWIFLSTLLTFLATQSDRLMIGKLLNTEVLGIYTVAFVLIDTPRSALKTFGGRLLFPLVSRGAHLERADLRHRILTHRRKAIFVLAVGHAVVCAFVDQVVLVLWDPRYAQAAWIAALLSLGSWLAFLFVTIGPSLLSVGKPQYIAIGALGRFVALAGGGALGYAFGGFLGLIIAIALSELPTYIVIQFGLFRERLSCLFQDAAATVLFGAAYAVLLILRVVMGLEMPWSTCVGF